MPGALADMESPGPEPPKVPEYGFIVSHQKLELELDFSTQSISGRTVITILPQTKDLQELKIHARQCEIPHNGVRINGSLAAFDHDDPMLALTIPAAYIWSGEQHALQKERISPLTSRQKGSGSLEITIPGHVKIDEVDPFSENAASAVTSRALGASAARVSSVALDGTNGPLSSSTFTPKTAAEQSARYQPLTVSISFTGNNFRDGLQFVGVSEGDSRFPHVYTRHSMDPGIACIFPCIDDPAMRCTWDISIKCSRTLGDALKRRPVPERQRGLQQILARRGLANGISNPPDDYEVPLSDDEKIMEMTVVCSGEMMTETTDIDDSSKKIVSFFCSTIVAPQHIGFAIGPFELVDLSEYREVEDDEKLGQGQTVPVTGYCLPRRADEVRYTCAAMAQGLDFFLLNFGGYPFSDCRLVFVDDQITDTAHAASLSFCSTRLLAAEDIKDTSVETTRTLIHAIASQWMGVSIVPNAPLDRWITVGLSHFMTGIFMKVLCGNNEYAFRQKTLSDRLVELDIDRPSLSALGEYLHLGHFALEFMELKAPLVIFILDKRIVKTSGSVGMTRVISKLITAANTGTSIDSVVSTDGFRRLVEKITKYRQTESFWKQWVEGAGCPRFAISQKFNKKRLCVEMTISQKQDTLPTQRVLEKGSFRREVKEEIHGVYAAELQPVFTGPMTIRIYEADGTPYDHVVEIREGTQKFDIQYNTKYKRLKRSRRQKERMNAGVEINADGGEELQYHSLGDVLSSVSDMRDWGLQEWDADTEQRMEQESYEWIRVDADFEWLAEKQFMAMPAYMYVSQLQQDRDVVAQQDSMVYLGNMNSHPLVATFLVRTLMDKRYFHGIRTMAAEYLKTHATKICGWVGLKHLEKAYQFFSCYAGSKMPKPNDFANGNEKTYRVEMAIIKSLSKVRDTRGNCPKEARHFLSDLLRFNDNSNNEFSDNFKLANLLSALTESLIPVKDESNVLEFDNDDMQDTEPEEFKNSVLEELDRYRRMDEWTNSYQNIFTVTVLECKARLMKAKVIPVDAAEFGQYLHDGTGDQIRIKAFESLIDLGFLRNQNVAALLLNCLSTDRSPYTRSRLFEVFCLGLASIAFGEKQLDEPVVPAPPPADHINDSVLNGEAMLLDGEHDGGLIVEQDASLAARKANILRTTTVDGAITALKEELKDNQSFKDALWNAVMSTSIGVGEQLDLLDVCGIIYDAVDSLIIRLPYPRCWEASIIAKVRFHLYPDMYFANFLKGGCPSEEGRQTSHQALSIFRAST
jgi:transcription initiation factor TFIID subunit 2